VAPVLTEVPFEGASYQFNTLPALEFVADRLTTPGPHLAAPVTAGRAGKAMVTNYVLLVGELAPCELVDVIVTSYVPLVV